MREISFRGRQQCSARVDSIEVAFEIEQYQSARKYRTNVKRGQTLTYKCCIVKQTKKNQIPISRNCLISLNTHTQPAKLVEPRRGEATASVSVDRQVACQIFPKTVD